MVLAEIKAQRFETDRERRPGIGLHGDMRNGIGAVHGRVAIENAPPCSTLVNIQ